MSATSSTIALGVGSAAFIAVNSGAGQQATVGGQPVPIAPSVFVTDVGNNPVPGAPVTFQVSPSGAIQGDVNCCNTVTVNTSASGIASLVSWTLGTRPGYSLTATLAGGHADTLVADGIALNGRVIEVIQLPAGGSRRRAAPTPVVMLKTVTGANVEVGGFHITAFLTSANGTLLGTTTLITNSRGQATFSGLTINAPAGAAELRFTSPGYVVGRALRDDPASSRRPSRAE